MSDNTYDIIFLTKKENSKYTGIKDKLDKWHETTKEVRDFLEGKLPCKIEVIQEIEDIIQRVKILNDHKPTPINNEGLIQELKEVIEKVINVLK